ncbi:MAG: aldehyde dehydrogenase family protein [Acidobacteriota bacterium]
MSRAIEIVTRAAACAAAFRKLDQRQTDRVVRAVYLAAMGQRVKLAKMAHEETGIGEWRHKVIKNVIATQLVYEDIKNQKTVGVISEDSLKGLVEVAQPLGPILGLIPVNNPTSTTIFKALICMKTRNPLIISPHPAARKSISASAETCYEAAREAGAPEDCIQWLDKPSSKTTDELMKQPRLALILATGTDTLVRKASMSGTPVIGVGPGNVPVYIGETADIPFAVRSIVESKTFDNGSVCASEQAVVVKKAVAEKVMAEFRRQGGHFLSPEEIERVSLIAYDEKRGAMTPRIVGQSVQRIAEMAGITVPRGSVLLLAPLTAIGRDQPLSAEILAPILAFYIEEDFDPSIRRCSEVTRFGGLGHTAVIYSNRDERIEYFSQVVDASRILVNMPSTQGALGGIFNTLSPSFTLSCGTGGNNITTDNITARHLLNIHRITRRRPNPRWVGFDQQRYLDESATPEAIEAGFNRNY